MKIYLAGAGDTPRSIARRSGVTLQSLLDANPSMVHADLPVRGMQVVIPEAPFQPYAEAPDSNAAASRLWIKTVPLEQMAHTEYDALIVGTGAGGGAALWRLCQRWKGTGKRIGIVEAGDPILPTNGRNLSVLSDELGEYYTSLTKPVASPEFRGARLLTALGGRTLLWDAVTPRMHPSVFAHWPIPYSEIEPYYTIAEQAMSVRKCPSATVSLVETVLERLCTRGFPETIHTPKALNFESLGADGQIQSEAYFSSIMFLAKARKLHPFDLAVRARAARVLTDGTSVRGVEAVSQNRQSVFLKAKTVILSASWLGSPAILLHSGIPGRAIGRYLCNHSFLRRDGNISPQDLISPYVSPFDLLIPQTADHPFQIQVLLPETPETKRIGFLAVGIVEPRFDNGIRLNHANKDSCGNPSVQIEYSLSAADREVTAQMLSAVQDALRAANLEPSQPTESTSGVRPPGSGNHETGTCRMGEDPHTSATNRYGQIHGIAGLYVADNSVIPYAGAANPTLTSAALAIRTADYISGQEA